MPQSIHIKNIESYQDYFEDRLLNFAKKENILQRFMLGEKQDRDVALHTIMMHEKMCPINCEVTDYIRDKIAGKLKERVKKRDKPLSYFIKVSGETEEEYIFDWNEIQW